MPDFFFLSQIMAVKKNIEDVQGKDNYPCGQQLLIHNGKVLKDETTLADNKVSEDGFLVVMLSKVYFFLHENFVKQYCHSIIFFFFKIQQEYDLIWELNWNENNFEV